MDERIKQLTQQVKGLAARLELLEQEVNKCDRLIYKLWERLPQEPKAAGKKAEPAKAA